MNLLLAYKRNRYYLWHSEDQKEEFFVVQALPDHDPFIGDWRGLIFQKIKSESSYDIGDVVSLFKNGHNKNYGFKQVSKDYKIGSTYENPA